MGQAEGHRKSILLSKAEARALTDEIRGDLNAVYGKIVTAFRGRAWQALEYTSWQEYCQAEFRGSLAPRSDDEIREAVAALIGEGLSQRAIAAATGVSLGKVNKEAPSERPDKTMGTDGKERGSRRLRIVRDETSAVQPEGEAIDVAKLSQSDWASLMVGESGIKGLTHRELSHTAEGWDHAQSSAALSRAKRRGQVMASGRFREGCTVFISAEIAG
jgi:hypothetical protein